MAAAEQGGWAVWVWGTAAPPPPLPPPAGPPPPLLPPLPSDRLHGGWQDILSLRVKLYISIYINVYIYICIYYTVILRVKSRDYVYCMHVHTIHCNRMGRRSASIRSAAHGRARRGPGAA